jgi:hypothetical protein
MGPGPKGILKLKANEEELVYFTNTFDHLRASSPYSMMVFFNCLKKQADSGL